MTDTQRVPRRWIVKRGMGDDGLIEGPPTERIEVVPLTALEEERERLRDLLSAAKQWRQGTESRLRMLDSRGEAAKSMLPVDRALIEAIERADS
jgi:hypothetical protein